MLHTAHASTGPDTLSRHHDLWVELASIEMSMESLGDADDAARQQTQLEQRREQLRQAMRCLVE